QRYFNAKSRICLRSFIVAFTINQYILYHTRLASIIVIVLLSLSGVPINVDLSAVKDYLEDLQRIKSSREFTDQLIERLTNLFQLIYVLDKCPCLSLHKYIPLQECVV